MKSPIDKGASAGCAGCGRTDKALFRTNAKGTPGIFKCRPCIDSIARISLGQDRELLDAIDVRQRVDNLRAFVTEHIDDCGPIVYATLTCDRCGTTVDILVDRKLPDGWVGGPPDYCPICAAKK